MLKNLTHLPRSGPDQSHAAATAIAAKKSAGATGNLSRNKKVAEQPASTVRQAVKAAFATVAT